MKRSFIRLAFLFVGFTALLAAAVRADTSAQKTYQAKCSACHGADGKGDTGAGKALGAHDFASPEVKKMSDAELSGIISNGKGRMPAYGKTLSTAEIKDLVDYIRGLAKK